MLLPFLKMHGAGNDFIIVDARAERAPLTPARIAALSDRHTGIGCDQFIILTAPSLPGAAVRMEIYNQDGSTAGACGNATRCVAQLMAAQGQGDSFSIETPAGLLQAWCKQDGITIDMGAPRLAWQEIPLAHAQDTRALDLPGEPAACSMGNPHITLFVPDLAAADIATRGPALEHHPLFPARVNVGFAQILSPERIRLRVWERGAGLTRACGSGACAALVNAHRRGLCGDAAELILDGGVLQIRLAPNGHVLMQGPAQLSFQGSADLSTYPP